jgi:hypothetical protein
MSDTQTRILREVLATMVSEAPPPVDFENLTDTRIVPERARSRRSPLVAVFAGFVVIVATLGGVFALTHESTPGTDSANLSSEATVFMMPEFIPDGLVLVLAEVTSSGSLTQQFYYEEGMTFSKTGDREGGEMIVEIVIVDRAEQLNNAGNDEDPLTDFSVWAAALRESNPDLVLNEMLIRSKPALVVEGLVRIDELTYGGIRIFVREGAAITSQVISEQLTLDTVIAIAESLTPTSPDVFDSSNWRYQDLSAAASVWLNQLGLNQTDEDVWSARLDTICAADSDLLGLAEQYVVEDAEYSVRSDGTLPTPEDAKESLEIISLQSCER